MASKGPYYDRVIRSRCIEYYLGGDSLCKPGEGENGFIMLLVVLNYLGVWKAPE